MAFAFTLENKTRADNRQYPATAKGERRRLVYSFTCLSTDTSGSLDISDQAGGGATITKVLYSLNGNDGMYYSVSGNTITLNKGGAAGTAGFLEVEVLL